MQAETSDVTMLLRELRQIGEEPPRALLDRVKALGPLVVRPLIALATDEALHRADGESPEVWAPLHAIHLLGELGAAEAVEPLLPLLGWQDDALSEDLPKALGQIGPAAVSPLRAVLFDRTQDLWAREGAASALAQIAQQHPHLRDEVIAILVGRLDPAESQTPADETLNGLIIGRLLDLEATEAAPAIQQAFAEDRVDQRIVDLASARHELELAPELVVPFPRRGLGVRLWLRCTACGYERAHDVAKVYCDLGTLEQRQRGEETSYSEFVIPQRITCPKCGAVDQYALTTEAHLALAAEGLVQASGNETSRVQDDAGERPLVYTRFTVAGDREMHPRAAQEMYRQQVATDPENADVRVRYASVLRFLGQRDEAVRQYRAAVQLDPSNVEAYLNLGLLAREAGDRTDARHLFERVLAVVPQARLPRREREEYMSYARAELERLEGVRPAASRSTAPVLASAPAQNTRRVPGPAARPTPKVGRNDPCPCGSGKKYKKCCGR